MINLCASHGFCSRFHGRALSVKEDFIPYFYKLKKAADEISYLPERWA